MFCPKCGTQMADDSVACPLCGTSMRFYTHPFSPEPPPKRNTFLGVFSFLLALYCAFSTFVVFVLFSAGSPFGQMMEKGMPGFQVGDLLTKMGLFWCGGTALLALFSLFGRNHKRGLGVGALVISLLCLALFGLRALGVGGVKKSAEPADVNDEPKEVSSEQHILDYLEETIFRDATVKRSEYDVWDIVTHADGEKEELYEYYWVNLDDDADCELMINRRSDRYLHPGETDFAYYDGYFISALDWDRDKGIVQEKRLVGHYGESIGSSSPSMRLFAENGIFRLETNVKMAKTWSEYDAIGEHPGWYTAEWYWSPFTNAVRDAVTAYGESDLIFVSMEGNQVECVGYAEDGKTEAFRETWDYYSPQVDALRKALQTDEKEMSYYVYWDGIDDLRASVKWGTKRLHRTVREARKPVEWGEGYMIRLDANGGLCNGEPVFVSHARCISVWFQPLPTRSGYTFIGWSKDEQGNEIVYGAGIPFDTEEDWTLYAVWAPNDA